MSSKSRQTNYALSTQILNALKEDGCAVDPTARVYDEVKTDNGGTGDRREFKRINDEINGIQGVLKILTGDERVTITEEPPVVDFAHPENTGFDKVYARNSNGTIDKASIMSLQMDADESEPSSAMRHMEKGEQIVNRALLGERSFMGCHLWNTNSMAVDEFNLQTSPFLNGDGMKELIYKGIFVEESGGYSIDTDNIKTYRTDTIQLLVGSEDEPLSVNLSLNGVVVSHDCACAVMVPKGDLSTASSVAILLSKDDNGTWVQSTHMFDTYSASASAENLTYGSVFPQGYNDIMLEQDKTNLRFVSRYINVEENHYSKASGLLNGLWSEPYDMMDNGNGYKVSKWRFSDDFLRAKEDGVDIPVGSHYYEGCLIGNDRGSIYNRPFMVTRPSVERVTTPDGVTHVGKATYIGSQFLNNSMENLLREYEVPSATWKRLRSTRLRRVVAYDDIHNTRNPLYRSGSSYLKSTHGSGFTMSDLINRYISCLDCDTFTLDLNGSNDIAYEYRFFNARTEDPTQGGVTQGNSESSGALNTLGTDASHFAEVQYDKVLYNGNVVDGYHVHRPRITLRDPMELLSGGSSTALLWDVEDNNMPTHLWLMSRDDLGIRKYTEDSTRSLVSFSTVFPNNPNSDKLMTLKCTDSKSFDGSAVGKYLIKDKADTEGVEVTLDDKYYEYSYQYTLDSASSAERSVKNLYEAYDPSKLMKPLKVYLKYRFKWSIGDVLTHISDPTGLVRSAISFQGASFTKMSADHFFDVTDGYDPLSVAHLSTLIKGVNGNLTVCICVWAWENMNIEGSTVTPSQTNVDIDNWTRSQHEDGDEETFSLGQLSVTVTCRSTVGRLDSFHAYKLEPFKVDTDISYYGQNNELITFGESGAMQLSYPNTYFQFDTNNVQGDWESFPLTNTEHKPSELLDSFIVVGLPEVTSFRNFLAIGDKTTGNDICLRSTTLDRMFNSSKGSVASAWKSSLYKALADWDMSSGNHPVKLRNVLSLINGIDELRKTGIDLDKLHIRTTVEGELRDITNSDLDNLWKVLDGRPDVTERVFTYVPKTDDEIKAYTNKTTALDATEATLTSEMKTIERKNLMEIKDILEPIMDSTTEPTLDTFIAMDEVFGNGSSFLRIGEGGSVGNIRSNLAEVERRMIVDVYSRMLTMTWNSDNLGKALKPYPVEMEMSDEELHLMGYEGDGARTRVAKDRREWVNENMLTSINIETGESYGTLSEALEGYSNMRADSYLEEHPDVTGSDTNVCDVDTNVLRAIAQYLTARLMGSYTDGNGMFHLAEGVKFVRGDKEVTGEKNSLYYKRYLYLNNRLNKTDGPLNKASVFLNNRGAIGSMDIANTNKVKAYEDYMSVLPVSRMTGLTYVPKQKAKFSDDMLFGGFYNTELLDSVRAELGKNCALTCTKCPVAENCMFYDHNVLLDQYIPKETRIDLFMKDNKLDLIGYERDSNGRFTSPSLMWSDGEESETLDPNLIADSHKPYLSIFNVDGSQAYDGIDLEERITSLNGKLQGENLGLDEEHMGWLTGARYGTVRENVLKGYRNVTDNIGQALPDKTVMYDAVFVDDEETAFNYTMSTNSYEVSVRLDGREYKGRTKLMIPTGLKILDEADDNADVYLVSDDNMVDGEKYMPVVYLNTAGVLRKMIRFDIDDNDPEKEATLKDKTVYAKDVAQFAVNVAKGDMSYKPIYSEGGNDRSDLDQIWMDAYQKKVVDENGREAWIELEGRPRGETSHSELICDVDSFNRALMVSGKPISANYINYLRKVSIPMLEETDGNTIIRTVRFSKYGNEDEVEKKKVTLSKMKTNLRLVVTTYDR